MSWSTGKDSAFALQTLKSRDDIEVSGLLTTITQPYSRVSMHSVRETLLDLQAKELNLPIYKVRISDPCSNEQYGLEMQKAILAAKKEGVSCIAFGDLFLEDIKQYRIKQLSQTGIEPLFPIWKLNTEDLAFDMIKNGLKAVLTCVDLKKLSKSFLGMQFDKKLLEALPEGIDFCGENGEFHSFVYDCPLFKNQININLGEQKIKNGFGFIDVKSIF